MKFEMMFMGLIGLMYTIAFMIYESGIGVVTGGGCRAGIVAIVIAAALFKGVDFLADEET